jgi:putative nucleotidyltransferase with HDIG domain
VATSNQPQNRWTARPVLARLLQLTVLAVPVCASVLAAIALGSWLPHAHDLAHALLWWVVVVAGSTAVLFAVDRVARRLLPLAVLLKLTLLFPDQAPKRYRVVAQSWNSKRIREQLHANTQDAPVTVASTVLALLANLSAHDRHTRGHCERVRALTDLLTDELGLAEPDRDRIRWAALIHDIGKLSVPSRLLNKSTTPTSREWQVLREHPHRGAKIAAPLAEWLGPWGLAIEQHHEHWDGSGYPHGLAGEEISLGGRIVAVTDAFEAMTSARAYGKPVTAASARSELASCAGKHFDPTVVRSFLNISFGRVRRVLGPVAWLAQVPVLAGMPRLEAVLVSAGSQAASNAGAAAGVVAVGALSAHAVTTAPATAHHATAVVAPAATQATGSLTAPNPTPAPSPAVLGIKVAKPGNSQASVHSRSTTSKHLTSAANTSGKHVTAAASKAAALAHSKRSCAAVNGNGQHNGVTRGLSPVPSPSLCTTPTPVPTKIAQR